MSFLAGLLSGAVLAALAIFLRERGRQAGPGGGRERVLEPEDGPGASRIARVEVIDSVAHELRTPLSAIMGHQELLQEGLYGELNERSLHAVRRIGAASTHLLHLIDGVLELARLEAGDIELDVTTVALEGLVREAREYAGGLAAERNTELDVVVPESLPSITTDARRLERVIYLTLTGAIRASPGAAGLRLGFGGDARDGFEMTLEGSELTPDADSGGEDGMEGDDPGSLARAEIAAALPGEDGRDGRGGGVQGRSWLRLTIARAVARRLGGYVRVEAGGAGPGAGAIVRVRVPQLPRPSPRGAQPGAPLD